MRTRLAALAAAASLTAAGALLLAAAPAPDRAAGLAAAAYEHAESGAPISRIAFGSCLKQNRPQPIWDAVLDADPDLFIFLGDNVYADTSDMGELKACYNRLAAQPGFQALSRACSVLATWDDHDYCKNGSGANFRGKRDSQRVFLDFWGDSEASPRRARDGVYDASTFGPEGQRVQVILLDARFFRSVRDKAMLGEEQWAWLEARLLEPADVRIIASCSQFVARHHTGDKWADIPTEMDRMVALLAKTEADGVVFITGDRHHAEISRLTARAGRVGGRTPTETGLDWNPAAERDPVPAAAQPRYPLYDITASSLNRSKLFVLEHNPARVGKPFPKANFGLIEIDWSQPDPVVTMQARDVKGKTRIRHAVKLSELRGAAGS